MIGSPRTKSDLYRVRIDKFLWCVRLCSARSQATEACSKQRVRINGREVKPAAVIKPGDPLSFKQAPIWRVYTVVALPPSRVGARLVKDHITEITPWSELEKLEIARKVRAMKRAPGSGRPTKRDRRDIERMFGN